MLKRDEMTKEYVDDLLKDALIKIEFGSTIMGIINDPQDGLVAVGRKDFQVDDPKYYYVLGVFGPVNVPVAATKRKTDSYLVESALNNIEACGLLDLVAAIVADSAVVFAFFSDGLIVGNCLGPVVNGYAEGKVILNGKEYKLLAVDGEGVLGTTYDVIAVDSNLRPIEPK